MHIGIFGATGEVGKEIINVLHDTDFPLKELYLYAGNSAGRVMRTQYGDILIGDADNADYSMLDLAFWAINGEWSKRNWPEARDSDCYIIDNSSAFRYDKDVPLIVPEINGSSLDRYAGKLISNPNCTTAIAAIPLNILHQLAGIERIIFTTYQAASGAGNGGRNELLEGSKNYLEGKKVDKKIFPHPLPFNIIPHIDTFLENNYTREEMKTDWETKKILGLEEGIKISSTCVRIPIERSHAEDLVVETSKPVDLKEFRELLDREPMIKVIDNPSNNVYPMPISTSGSYAVEVGRIRHPAIFENGVRMFVCGDQLLRGAALNAVLIARKLYELEKI